MSRPRSAQLLWFLVVCLAPSRGSASDVGAVPTAGWADAPVVRPRVPRSSRPEGQLHPIDAFLARRLDERGLTPQPAASKPVLLRRVFLDLVGVPPTPGELHAFLADERPDAYERVVDRLLASPLHGERWGRHWMDVWRYSDWYGRRAQNEIRYGQYHLWRWRDWIVESLNADKGYDRMIVEMLAGDEVAPDDPDVLRATGFLGRNWYKFDRDVWFFQTVEETCAGFLALSTRCARCHDHKYDPLTQEEYYRLRAFFEPHALRIDPVPGESDLLADGVARAFDGELERATFLYTRGDPREPEKDRPLTPATPAFLGGGAIEITPRALPLTAYYPALRPDNVRALREAALARVAEADAALAEARRELTVAAEPASGGEALDGPARASAGHIALLEKRSEHAAAELASLDARVAAETARHTDAPPERVAELAAVAGRAERRAALSKAEADVLAARAHAASLAEPSKEAAGKVAAAEKARESAREALVSDEIAVTPLGRVSPRTTSGRRLALARWIAQRDNPRTARVAVNHIWLRHFGEALAPTVDDFGGKGKPPTHPELLDWLAAELVDGGWRMKRIHRLIVTSSAYRRSSSTRDAAANLARDPENTFLWRMNSRRMEAEVVRDAVLAVAGRLDLAMGGPELDESLAARGAEVLHRRSVYYRTTPDNRAELFELFDQANPLACYRRQVSVVPQQALALMNSALALDCSRLLARRLTNEQAERGDDGATGDGAFVTAAFERILCRAPRRDELDACLRFLDERAASFASAVELATFANDTTQRLAPASEPRLRAREGLILVLFSHNDYVTIR